MNYGGHHLNVLMSKGKVPSSPRFGWTVSLERSSPFPVDKIEADKVQLNGGVRYIPKTDGRRNDLYERFFVNSRPSSRDACNDRNPPAKRGHEAATRLWQESWGPADYEREHGGRRSCVHTALRC